MVLPEGAPGIATLVIFVIIGVMLATSMLMAAVNTIKVDRTYKIGKRLGEVCGMEYLELETAQHNLQSKFSSTQPIGKSFLATLDVIRAAMTIALYLILVVLWLFLYVPQDQKGVGWAFAAVILAWFVAALIMWIVGWTKTLKKGEANMFYQDRIADAENDYKKYKKDTLRFGIPVIGVTFLLGAGTLAMKQFMDGPSRGNFSQDPSKNDKTKLLEWYKSAGILLIFTSVLWTSLFVIYRWYAKGFFDIAKTINGEYYGSLITGDDKLGPLVNGLYTEYMKSVASDSTDTTKQGGVLENVIQRVDAMFVKHFATNIREYDPSNQGDDKTVISKVVKEGSLWKYMKHREGQELEEVRAFVESKLGNVKNNAAIVTWRNDLFTRIRKIRNIMREIRGNTTFQRNIRKFVRQMLLLICIVIGVLMFLVFHRQYEDNPGRTVMTWCIGIILLTILMTVYGWVNTAVRL